MQQRAVQDAVPLFKLSRRMQLHSMSFGQPRVSGVISVATKFTDQSMEAIEQYVSDHHGLISQKACSYHDRNPEMNFSDCVEQCGKEWVRMHKHSSDMWDQLYSVASDVTDQYCPPRNSAAPMVLDWDNRVSPYRVHRFLNGQPRRTPLQQNFCDLYRAKSRFGKDRLRHFIDSCLVNRDFKQAAQDNQTRMYVTESATH